MKVHKLGKILNVGNPVAINTEVNLVDFTLINFGHFLRQFIYLIIYSGFDPEGQYMVGNKGYIS